MELTNLTPNAVSGLRDVSGPIRYLYPGPDRSRTGPIDRSLLLSTPRTGERVLSDPGFHRLYRLLEQGSDLHVEHAVRPSSDFLNMAEERNLFPWSLESRRSIFSFPTWLVYLSWPGEWWALRDYLDALADLAQDQVKSPEIYVFLDTPLPIIDPPDLAHPLVTIIDGSSSNHPRKIRTRILDHLREHYDGSRSTSSDNDPTGDGDSVPEKQLTHPIPFLNNQVKDTFWIGDPVAFNQNRSLQRRVPFSCPVPSPADMIERTARTFDESGLRTVSIGSLPDRDRPREDQWVLEYTQRFCSTWPDRPVCYRLENPHPNRALWTYPQLVDGYSNESLRVHLGACSDFLNGEPDASGRRRWLNHFLSGGGPKMTFYTDVTGPAGNRDDVRELIGEITDLNERAIDGKGQLFLYLQPDLTEVERWKSDREFRKWLQPIRDEYEDESISVELHLPEHYSALRQKLTGT